MEKLDSTKKLIIRALQRYQYDINQYCITNLHK